MARVEILEFQGKEYSPLGRHIIAELYNCDSRVLSDVERIKEVFLEAARKANMNVIKYDFHHFRPFGVSGVVIVSESHLAVHTWPEFGYAAVDIYVCGDESEPWEAYKVIFEGLGAKNATAMEIKRGILVEIKGGEAGKVE